MYDYNIGKYLDTQNTSTYSGSVRQRETERKKDTSSAAVKRVATCDERRPLRFVTSFALALPRRPRVVVLLVSSSDVSVSLSWLVSFRSEFEYSIPTCTSRLYYILVK